MVKVLIAGASGYVGETLALELRRRGHDVYGLVRDAAKAKELLKGEVKVIVGNISQVDTFSEIAQKVDVIVNTSQDFSNPELEAKAFEAISAALKNAPGEKKKVIFTSGFLVYQPSPKQLTENSPTLIGTTDAKVTQSPLYGILKTRLETEKLVLDSKLFYGTIARAPFVYGRTRGRWSIYFQQATTGKITVPGDGEAVLGYLHIDDLVEGMARVVEANASVVGGQIFHFAEPERVTQKEVALAFAKGAGHEKAELEFAPFPPAFSILDGISLWLDISKAKKDFGMDPRASFSEGCNSIV